MEDLELNAQEYSVFITDEAESSSGSGVLYATANSDRLFVFTCAHVIEELQDPVCVYMMIPREREQEEYETVCMKVKKDTVQYSPVDHVQEKEGVRIHSQDVAVLCITKTEGLYVEKSEYMISEPARKDRIFILGFPGGVPDQECLVEHLDIAEGTILHNVKSNDRFSFRLEDDFLDPQDRQYELAGISGAPVWNRDAKVLSILGLAACGDRENIFRAKVYGVKMKMIQSIMKNHFNICIPTQIPGIPEEDVADGAFSSGNVEEEKRKETDNIYDRYVNSQVEKVRTYIDTIKFQKAIDLSKELIRDQSFSHCSVGVQKKVFQYLLYCCESCLLDEEYEKTEEEMRKRKMIGDHDPLRWMTLNFGKKNFQEVIHYGEKVIQEKKGSEQVLKAAEFFCVLCRAYTEKLPIEKTMLVFFDEKENLKMDGVSPEMESLFYQMGGYVYGECYKEFYKAVRCLNRSYRIGNDHAVLETLACAYYFLGIKDAADEEDQVAGEKIDRASLYKARKCFLLLLSQADELYQKAMIKREGLILYNTFVFLMDNYRVLKIYPELIKNLTELDEKERRDIELKYLKVVCQGGRVDLSEFTALEEQDKIMAELMGLISETLNRVEYQDPRILKQDSILENDMARAIFYIEKYMGKVEKKEVPPLVMGLMNLYGSGIRIFKWKAEDRLKECFEFIKRTQSSKVADIFSDFVFENTHSLEEAEQRFIESWKRSPSIETWMELTKFYERNWMLEKADGMFRELFEKHFDYIKDEPEYAYRAYIFYIVSYRRDVTDALEFYENHKNEMLDEELRGYWHHELMMCTNSFNDPEIFEEDRRMFMEEGFVPEDDFHRGAMVAYMLNLDRKNACKHWELAKKSLIIRDPKSGGAFFRKEAGQFLSWQVCGPTCCDPLWKGMSRMTPESLREVYEKEEGKCLGENVLKQSGFFIKKDIVMDAYALYFLSREKRLEELDQFDHVYVTHFSIGRIFEEICHEGNEYLHRVLFYLEKKDNTRILSPSFETQIKVRKKVTYYEPCSTVALALEMECLACIGEPQLQEELTEFFGRIMVRPFLQAVLPCVR